MSAVGVPTVIAGGAVQDGFVRRLRRLGRWRRDKTRWLIVVIIFKESFPKTGIMRNARGLALDELSEEAELNVVGHDVGGTLDVATLHE